MNKLLNIDPSIDLNQCILWQYVNSFALKNLILAKQNWYKSHHTQFWQDWYNNVFNLNTANDFGLSVWGEILNFPRNIVGKDGLLHYLTTEQYRLVLKGEILKFGMGATVPEMNNWLKVVFADKGNCFCLDNQDMTAIPIVFRKSPDDEIKWLLGTIDFFPRPAGVGYQIRIIPNDVFGFNGSGLQPFNQGVFSNDYSEILQPPEEDSYQLSINAPAGATVRINGTVKRWALLEENESYTWEVTQNGYLSASGSGIITQDILIEIGKFSVTSTEGSVFVNNQTAKGAFFVKGIDFAYSYNVGQQGYLGVSGSGVISDDKNISVSRLLINPTPSDAEVTLNGQPATGAFFLTGTEFEYSYTVSKEGLEPLIESGVVTQDTIINAQALKGKWEINNIQTTSDGGVSEVGTYTLTSDADVDFIVASGQGLAFNSNATDSYGVRAEGRITLSKNDVVKIKKINGGYMSTPTPVSEISGGCGVALFVNDSLKVVCGGGATVVTVLLSPTQGYSKYVACGGGGSEGGYCTEIQDPVGFSYNGFSIDGTRGNSQANTLSFGCGGSTRTVGGLFNIESYGGSGANYTGTQVSFSQNFGAGFVKLTITPK